MSKLFVIMIVVAIVCATPSHPDPIKETSQVHQAMDQGNKTSPAIKTGNETIRVDQAMDQGDETVCITHDECFNEFLIDNYCCVNTSNHCCNVIKFIFSDSNHITANLNEAVENYRLINLLIFGLVLIGLLVLAYLLACAVVCLSNRATPPYRRMRIQFMA